jgi:type IX secretion system PorP/SprF family membrane protein
VKKTAVILFLLIICNFTFSQQMPIYSQYLFNKFLINPAVAGSDGYTTVNLTAREQWVGYSGAPRTFSLSMQGRLLKKKLKVSQSSGERAVFRPKSDGRVGLGGYIFSDRNGLIQRTGFQLSYSYHMWLQSNTQLSLGISMNGYHYKIDEAEIRLEDPDDPLLNSNLRRGVFVPDVTFGTYLLNPNFSLGLSVDQLLEAAVKIGSQGYEKFQMKRQYYLFGSYDFASGNTVIIRPSFLLMMSEQLKPLADLGVTYYSGQDYWAGLAYRTSGALIATAGVRFKNIFIGYAFDFTLQEIQRITYGTHELSLAVKFGDSNRRYRWLDRY